ncbi:MAG TPA: hypothetical protein VMN60_13440 [Longimicrobiales bacterium]|nr:hypothetical protein [Longimicrobiales bacterium]
MIQLAAVKTMRALLCSVAAIAPSACGVDVFDGDDPTATVTGAIVYNGVPVGLRRAVVKLELRSADTRKPLPSIFVLEDGTFSATVRHGDYLLNLVPGTGP